MNALIKKITRRLWPTCLFVTILGSWPCYGHEWQVHQAITGSAYQFSGGLQSFLNENLDLKTQLLAASLPQCAPSGTASNWLCWGSKMEDEQLYGHFQQFKQDHDLTQRSVDHFYTVAPDRTPGQVPG